LDAYLEELHPALAEVKAAADAVLGMNQDAIVRKSEVAQRAANRYVTFLAIAAALGLLIAIIGTATITSRVVRPLSILGQATRRLGEGDLASRAQVAGTDEIARVAGDFNRMA